MVHAADAAALPACFCMAVIIYRALLKTVKETDLLCLHLFGALISLLLMATRHVEAHPQRIRKAKKPDSTMLRSLLERLVRFFMDCRGESAQFEDDIHHAAYKSAE